LRRRDWMISDAGMQSVRRRTSWLDTCWL